MEVRIPKELFKSHECLLTRAPFNCDGKSLDWRDHIDLDLHNLKTVDLEKLAAVMEDETVRGAKTLVRDIRNWIQALSGFKGAATSKCRSVRKALPLMIQYLGRVPGHHIYERIQEGNEGVVLGYFVSEIEYVSKSQYCPEHLTMDLVYEEFGLIHRDVISFYPADIIGQTPHQILVNAGYLPETPQLYEDYQFFLEDYIKWKDLTGHQFLGVGIADDDGIDGNDSKEDRWWRSSRSSKFKLDHNGEPARIVIDVFRETSKEDKDKHASYSHWFWKHKIKLDDDTDEVELDGNEEDESEKIDIPVHPYVAAFDLTRHKRLRIHVGNLKPYEYDTSIGERLVLPERNRLLIDTLLGNKKTQFRDILKGKSGGTIVLCQGKPGTGKTLTAEVYAEHLGRPLYTVQCSQLGTDPDDLEDNLMKVLARGRRWNAVMLLDEADVYVHERGSDLQQNAIVGVFLRVLEYHAGVLFLTTNRGDLVDDAILSRCTARIPYDVPSPEDQTRIWNVLAAANSTSIQSKHLQAIVAKFPRLSGRDIKNLLKLSLMVRPSGPIDVSLIEEVKVFKPTSEE